MTHTIAIEQAESQFAQLLSAVLAGDEVVLMDQERPVARLSPVHETHPEAAKPRIAGLHEGSMWMSDDFNEPMALVDEKELLILEKFLAQRAAGEDDRITLGEFERQLIDEGLL